MYYKYFYENRFKPHCNIYCVVNTDLKEFTMYKDKTKSMVKLSRLCGYGNEAKNTMSILVKTKKDITKLIEKLRNDDNYKEI